jgi:very-short-patch-repair endonuclease
VTRSSDRSQQASSAPGLGLPDALERKLRRQIAEWRAALVAVDGRQRLVYFKHVQTASLEICAPGLDGLLGVVATGNAIVTTEQAGDFDDDQGRLTALRTNRPRIDVGNKTPEKLPGALRRLDQVSQSTYADRGFWSLYIGAGFLCWLDPDEKPVESPLLLVPVQLHREGDAGTWSLASTEDDIVLNPALQLLMEQNYGIALPTPDADGVVVRDYLAQVAAAVAGQQGWTVAERAVLTNFSFHKEAIFRDLLNHEQQVLEHPMVQLLALGPDSPTGEQFDFQPVHPDDVDRVMPPEQLMSILDADSSQRRCILAARDGRSFVMDGPPGTGKSQTIANIVVELMASGRSVLFVSEKAAALDVVRNRRADHQLSPFLLQLHSHAATRKQVAAELHRALTQSPRATARFTDVELSALTQDRLQLTTHVEAMNEVRKGLGRSLFDVLGRVAHLEAYRHVAVPVSARWADLDDSTLAAILDRSARLARAWEPVLQGDAFLWRDVAYASTGQLDVDGMRRSAQQARDAVAALRGRCAVVDEDLGMSFGNRQQDVERRHQVLTLVESRPEAALISWLSASDSDFTAIHHRASELKARVGKYQDVTSRLLREAGPRHAELNSDRTDDVESLLDPVAVGWVPGGATTATRSRHLVQWLSELPQRLVEVHGMTQRLGVALGFGTENPTLSVARRLADLAVLGEATARPLAPWFNPSVHAALQESERVLGTLVDAMRGRRAALEGVFTSQALDLELAALDHRFREVHIGFRRWSSQARADRKQLKAVTVSGKVTPDVLSLLGEAAEWQRAEHALDQGEVDHASRLGTYYRRGDTDFGGLSTAIEIARHAVRLAGDDLDMRALSSQLGADGDPDPLLTTLGARLQTLAGQLHAEIEQQLGTFGPGAMDMPLHQLAEWCGRAAAAFSVGVEAAEHVAAVTGRDVTVRETRDVLRVARGRDEAGARIFETYENDQEMLGPAYRGLDTSWGDLEGALAWVGDVREQLGGAVAPVVAEKVVSPSLTAADLTALVDRWSAAADGVRRLFLDSRSRELGEAFAVDLEEAEQLLDEMTDRAATDIEDWVQYTRLTEWFGEQGLGDVVEELVDAVAPAVDVAPMIERATLMAWVDATVRADDRLERYRAADRDALVEDFRVLDRRQVEDRYAAVVSQCAARRPSSNGSRAAQVITREAAKKTRHKPIRQLLAETASLVQDLKPCFMMSPLAVSQFLPADMRFDVVIFDEASQVLPWDAVNCVYRGDALIVAGDEKQLEPTAFFTASTDSEDLTEDDDEATDSFESLLLLAKASGALPNLPLLWHYRSQHESLISYSNHRIYEGELHSFPGATFDAPDLGVKSFVVDGVYNRGTTRDNPIEAEFVVDRVLHHATAHPHLSIGVVEFSSPQVEAVFAAMERRSVDEPVLRRLLSDHDRLDGFFIKSLESVQGDERDVVIFTVGYGPDEFGKMTMNFGPLNRKRGWRRLNVAVTRARRRVEVISSFRAGRITTDEFPVPSDEQNGVPHLKAYLDFAARGLPALAVDAREGITGPESPFEEDVLQVVRSMGYAVDPQVGSAGYRIDMAVRHPEREGEYVLAIECDGAMYHSAKAARDRDRLRQQVLEGLGWRMHRIWGLSWVRDRRGQTERLRVAIEAAVRGDTPPAPRAPEVPAPEVLLDEVDFDAKPDWAVAYPTPSTSGRRPSEWTWATPGSKDALPAIRTYLERVLREEAPLHHGRLLERFRGDWEVGRAGAAIQQNIDLMLSKVVVDGRRTIRDSAGFLSLSGTEISQVRVPTGNDGLRKVGWVPPAELDLAVLLLVRDARTMGVADLSTAVARLFGWRRQGSDIQAAVSASISRLEQAGSLVNDGGELRLGDRPPPLVSVVPERTATSTPAAELLTLFDEEPDQPAVIEEMLAAATRLLDERTKAGEESAEAASGRASNPPTKRLLRSFDDRVRADLAYVRAACGYEPAHFSGRVVAAGARQAVRELLADEDARFNWRRLAKSSLLHKSPAASVLDPDFSAMFSPQELAEARKRLAAFEPMTDDVAAVLRKPERS